MRQRGLGLCTAVLLLAMVPAGCELLAPGSSSDSTRRVMADGGSVEIELGTAVRLGVDGPYLYFAEVTEDSRCPSGVMCFWEGRAKVEFRITGRDRDSDIVVASIPGLIGTPYEENNEILVDEFVLKLLALEPYPEWPRPPATSYRATLSIGELPE